MLVFEDHVESLEVEEHLIRGEVIYRGDGQEVSLSSGRNKSFEIRECGAPEYPLYIDWFALAFGVKEKLRRRSSTGFVKIVYPDSRGVRDDILTMSAGELILEFLHSPCTHSDCQYYSFRSSKSKDFNRCVLAKYRILSDSFTLEEVGKIYTCTRERIRQIEEKALRRLRHPSRINRIR
ncbi:MAG: hypothetical protein GY861_21835 [bacterium]|nr:hypothetical protein [bacterium]